VGEAQELGGNGMRLDMIKTRKTRDKKIEVVAILVLDPKIVDNEAKGDLGRDVAEERGGRGL
jgi:hypothetical protein